MAGPLGRAHDGESSVFNQTMTPTSRRDIDFHDGDKIGEKALKTLIYAAVELNISSAAHRPHEKSIEGREQSKAAFGLAGHGLTVI